MQTLGGTSAVLVHGAVNGQHARSRILAGRAGNIAEIIGSVATVRTEGVGADAGVHGPGGHFHAVKGQGKQQGGNVHVVHVVAAALAPSFISVVVVVGARPEGGEAHILVELVGSHHGGHVVVEHVAAGGVAGQGQGLDAHAHLQVSLGHHPVDVGVLHFDDTVAVSAQRAAFRTFAPGLVADFKPDRAGQGFGGHGVQLQTHALGSFELVLFLVEAGLAVAAGEVAVLAVVKAHDPLALRLEVDGAGARGSAEHEPGRQQKSSDLFHG